jgi:FkbM family methyltransferase
MRRAIAIRIDLWEVLLVFVLVAMVSLPAMRQYYLTPPNEAEFLLQRYQQKYGSKVSQNAEEWIIRGFFNDRRGGVFLDVGANSYKNDSTTDALEKTLGWSGVAVEPQPQFAEDYARFRPRTILVQAFASDHSGTTTLYVPERWPGLASSDPAYVAGNAGKVIAMQVQMMTLDSILTQAKVDKLDFMSMDIENAEPVALAGFSIERYRPTLACVEAHYKVRQAILNYFAEHGYVLVGKFWNVDLINMYFTPMTSAQASASGP